MQVSAILYMKSMLVHARQCNYEVHSLSLCKSMPVSENSLIPFSSMKVQVRQLHKYMDIDWVISKMRC